MAEVRLNPPTERRCSRCGRRDVWDEDQGGWVISDDSDGPDGHNPYCIHEWDINGTHNPILEP